MPDAKNVEDLVDAPVVAINGDQILIDGALAGSVREIQESGRLAKVDEVFKMLVEKRSLFRQINPNKTFTGVCLLQIDRDEPALAVKAVFQTAALAGYPNVSFLVEKRASLPD